MTCANDVAPMTWHQGRGVNDVASMTFVNDVASTTWRQRSGVNEIYSGFLAIDANV